MKQELFLFKGKLKVKKWYTNTTVCQSYDGLDRVSSRTVSACRSLCRLRSCSIRRNTIKMYIYYTQCDIKEWHIWIVCLKASKTNIN